MLVLKRKVDEAVIVTTPDGSRIRVLVVDFDGASVKLGFEAARDITIHREEVQEIVDRD